MVATIAWREFRSLFLSPLAWTVLAVVYGLTAYLFLGQVDRFQRLQPRLQGMDSPPGVTDVVVGPVFSNASFVLLLVVPLVTMRLIAGERRNGTLPVLLTAPVSMTRIVLGKYVGVLGFLGVLLVLLLTMPLALWTGTNLDIGKVGAGLLGLALMLAAFAAAGLFMSSLTRQPTLAAVATFGLLLLIWVLNWTGNLGGPVQAVVNYLSFTGHFEGMRRGLVSTTDVAYYLLFILTFLVLAVRRLDAERLHG